MYEFCCSGFGTSLNYLWRSSFGLQTKTLKFISVVLFIGKVKIKRYLSMNLLFFKGCLIDTCIILQLPDELGPKTESRGPNKYKTKGPNLWSKDRIYKSPEDGKRPVDLIHNNLKIHAEIGKYLNWVYFWPSSFSQLDSTFQTSLNKFCVSEPITQAV